MQHARRWQTRSEESHPPVAITVPCVPTLSAYTVLESDNRGAEAAGTLATSELCQRASSQQLGRPVPIFSMGRGTAGTDSKHFSRQVATLVSASPHSR